MRSFISRIKPLLLEPELRNSFENLFLQLIADLKLKIKETERLRLQFRIKKKD